MSRRPVPVGWLSDHLWNRCVGEVAASVGEQLQLPKRTKGGKTNVKKHSSFYVTLLVSYSCFYVIQPVAFPIKIYALTWLNDMNQEAPLLTYSMVHSPSWEANWFAASQEIPRISRKHKVHYRTHRRPPPVFILGQPNPVHIPTSTSWRSILILSTHLCIGLPSGLLPSGFPTKTLYTSLSLPIRATYPAHLILLDYITRTILGEEYKSFSSSLCNLLHSPVTSSLLGPNILLNTMFSNTLSFLSSRSVNDQKAPYCVNKQTGNGMSQASFIQYVRPSLCLIRHHHMEK